MKHTHLRRILLPREHPPEDPEGGPNRHVVRVVLAVAHAGDGDKGGEDEGRARDKGPG